MSTHLKFYATLIYLLIAIYNLNYVAFLGHTVPTEPRLHADGLVQWDNLGADGKGATCACPLNPPCFSA